MDFLRRIYGYMKSPEDRHKLIIDPEAAGVVRMIFDWYVSGVSASRIVKQLNALQIIPPSVYKASKQMFPRQKSNMN